MLFGLLWLIERHATGTLTTLMCVRVEENMRLAILAYTKQPVGRLKLLAKMLFCAQGVTCKKSGEYWAEPFTA